MPSPELKALNEEKTARPAGKIRLAAALGLIFMEPGGAKMLSTSV